MRLYCNIIMVELSDCLINAKTKAMQKINLSIVFLVSLLFFSCTVTKRKYLPGNHVEWNVLNGSVQTAEQNTFTKDETKDISALTQKSEIKPQQEHKAELSADTLPAIDTIITKRSSLGGKRPDTLICQITKITPSVIVYIKDGATRSIYRRKVQHVNRPLYSAEQVRVMAKRSKAFGWIAFFCFFPGFLLFMIPLLIGIPMAIIASRDSKRALEEIKKNPGDYSDATKKQAQSGRRATKILSTTLLIAWAAATAFIIVLFAIVLKNGS